MTVEEFNTKRKIFIIDPDLGILKFPIGKLANVSHAKWFTETGYPYLGTVRGYYWKDDNDEFVMLYQNNFEVPNVSFNILSYLFEYLPEIKWIGLGCKKGKHGELWEPQFKCYRQ